MTKMNLKKLVKVETWRDGKKRIVARNPDGTIDQHIKYAGSKAKVGTINDYRKLYKQQRSLKPNQERMVISQKTGTIQQSNFIKTSLDNVATRPIKKPRGKASYFVSGEVVTRRGKRITVAGTSNKKGSGTGDSETSAQCKETAWVRFLSNLAATLRGNEHYDADEGIQLVERGKVENLREGWVRFK